jgi:plasmid stability protein
MATTSVTLNIPNEIYARFKRKAEQAHRSVETELMEAVITAVPPEDIPDSEIQEAVTALNFLDDKTLWRVARNKLPKKEADKIESLHLKRQSEGLTQSEAEILDLLMKKYDKTFVLRNKAMELLMQRGHDISEFAPKP